ncbi:MAG: flagellar hook basal-body protein [Ignavibacteriales bacterium]|nr:flagellar hook basal-body protein [Ignavibacteriales bacterium]
MVKAIYQAARNLNYKTQNIEIVANNLANLNTIGYKRQLPFSEILTREQGKNYKQLTDFSEGNVVASNNTLDLSMRGSGFFVLQGEKGKELTRDGRFHISEEGYLVNSHGKKVLGTKGEINLYEALIDKKKNIEVTKDGEIMMGDMTVDKLMVGTVKTQENMLRTDTQDFRYEGTEFDEASEADYKISQGYIEESNVSPIIEMQSMIMLNKDFEATQKIIGFFDTSLGKAAEVGRVY